MFADLIISEFKKRHYKAPTTGDCLISSRRWPQHLHESVDLKRNCQIKKDAVVPEHICVVCHGDFKMFQEVFKIN